MSLFGELHVPADAFALYETLPKVPNAVVEIERMVATEDHLAPYFWLSGCDPAELEVAVEADPSIENVDRIDGFDGAWLYRADWTEKVDIIVYAHTTSGAIILEAVGGESGWELRMRFDDRDCLDRFRRYCDARDIPFRLTQLTGLDEPRSGIKYGLTPKQHEALTRAWEMGYFEIPRNATLADVADEFGISEQSLSCRLRRGHDVLVANALRTPPSGERISPAGAPDDS